VTGLEILREATKVMINAGVTEVNLKTLLKLIDKAESDGYKS
jgi:hypothetical protein